MEPLDLLEALRRETRELQTDTEAVALRLVESDPGGYAALLGELRALHLSAANVLGRDLPDASFLPRFDLRPRLVLLERDISELGLPLEPSPPFEGLHIDSSASALGLIYVIEGASLAGSPVARRTRALWKVVGRGEPPLHYLTSEGLDLGARWRTFSSELAAFGTTHPDAGPEVIGAAQRTLLAFADRLQHAWPAVPSAAWS
jgi:heme oxygenase